MTMYADRMPSVPTPEQATLSNIHAAVERLNESSAALGRELISARAALGMPVLSRIQRDGARRGMSDVLTDEAWMWGDGE